ncbi:MAG: hypothetical protein U0S50_02730 [Sphingopyxis sp.]|uniref:hypothetical protein n=1 Tax=Sphingopyxis sp. TaxID=1908224 RepID=UPI002ABA308D|nr:hypothetical protein [Sphingopyxis sp.]MDZ3830717.1 hypothetical protein [Sphingopyxis sp.]
MTTLNGLSADGAESALQSRGFKYIDSNTNSMGYTYSYWWDNGDKHCVRVEAHRGRIESIIDAKNADCHQSGGNTAAAVGAVAGLAILGAVLAHKSNHHSDGRHSDDAPTEQQYDRGYQDGLYNAPYHNFDRSDAYSSGYEAGVDQRNANLRSHHGRGGYTAVAQYQDLQGARAAGAMDELTRRGFVQVDNFTSGNARYSIQWRAASRQCLQVIIADGHIDDVRDIGRHDRCR